MELNDSITLQSLPAGTGLAAETPRANRLGAPGRIGEGSDSWRDHSSAIATAGPWTSQRERHDIDRFMPWRESAIFAVFAGIADSTASALRATLLGDLCRSCRKRVPVGSANPANPRTPPSPRSLAAAASTRRERARWAPGCASACWRRQSSARASKLLASPRQARFPPMTSFTASWYAAGRAAC